MAGVKETVLYYTPERTEKAAKVKGVLVQMGVRIKNISPEQVLEQVGYLAGLKDYEPAEKGQELPQIEEEVLVLKDFSGKRLDEFLMNLKKAKIPRINLKAVLTDTNSKWTFYHLYQEIKGEHESLQKDS